MRLRFPTSSRESGVRFGLPEGEIKVETGAKRDGITAAGSLAQGAKDNKTGNQGRLVRRFFCLVGRFEDSWTLTIDPMQRPRYGHRALIIRCGLKFLQVRANWLLRFGLFRPFRLMDLPNWFTFLIQPFHGRTEGSVLDHFRFRLMSVHTCCRCRKQSTAIDRQDHQTFLTVDLGTTGFISCLCRHPSCCGPV